MPTLGDLLVAPTRREVVDQLLALYRAAGFPTASWQSGSVARHLTEASASVLADLAALIVLIAKGGFLDYAEGAWLDLLARSLYAEERKPAVFTRGVVRLTDAGAQGPLTLAPGTYWVATRTRARRFRNLEGATLPRGGFVDVIFEAESAGAAWSVGNDEITELLSPGGTGVDVTNPPGTRGTWISQQGADSEKDPAFRQRCRDKWATIGSGSTEAAYRYWATTAAAEVTRVRVAGSSATGVVTVCVAGPMGPISDAGLAQVAAVVEARRPLAVDARVVNVSALPVPVRATLYLGAGAVADDALGAAAEAVSTYARESDIGATIYRARLIATFMDVPGVRNLTLVEPTGDASLGPEQTFSPTFFLTTSRLA